MYFSLQPPCWLPVYSDQTHHLCWQGVLWVHRATWGIFSKRGLSCEFFRNSMFEKVEKSGSHTSVLITPGPKPVSSLCRGLGGAIRQAPLTLENPRWPQLPEAPTPSPQPSLFLDQRNPSVNSACVGIRGTIHLFCTGVFLNPSFACISITDEIKVGSHER